MFKFINVQPVSGNGSFQVNFSSDSGSNYNVVKTTTVFGAHHYTDNSNAYLNYSAGEDLCSSTAFQNLNMSLGSGSDEGTDGEMHLYNPSSTTYVKQFYTCTQGYVYVDMSRETFVGGFLDTTSAIDAVRFQFNNANMNGTIQLWGL